MGQIGKLNARYVKLAKIQVQDVVAMHSLFSLYYNNAPLDVFMKDLSRKEGVLVMREKETGAIKGFTTIAKVPLQYRGKKALGIFSGDTVLDKEYWGSTALQTGYIKYLLKTKFLSPGTPLFWLLISKGYKTYLLMANNVKKYHPRYDRREQPELASLVEQYCGALFGKRLSEGVATLNFGSDYQKLKEEVAPITDAMRRHYPKIAFFEEMNPTWQNGTELPCIGEIDFATMFGAMRKTLRKVLRKPARSQRVPQELGVAGKVLKYKYQR